MSFWTIFLRSCRLRCPRCGNSKLFAGWFQMRQQCDSCGLKYERAPGYFLGSIYFNYGVTAMLVTLLYFACYFGEWIPAQYLLWSMATFSFLFPVWFFRYARSLWVGMDQFVDPLPEDVLDGNESNRPN